MDPPPSDRKRAAALALAEAFANDPLLEIVAPDRERRAKIGPAFLGVPVAYGLRYGRVWTNDDVSAVAVWIHPESGPVSAPRMLRAGLWRMPLILGMSGMRRFSKVMAVTDPFHELVEGPHWYLMAVGTRISRQGQGLGSILVEEGTSRADEAGLPCYLETGTDANTGFYKKRGFEIIGQGDCLGYTLTAMICRPR